MRHAIFLIAIVMVIGLHCRIANADHDMTCHPPDSSPPTIDVGYSDNFFSAADEDLNLIAAGAGAATSTSCNGAGGDALPAVLPSGSFSAIEHIPGAGRAARYWLFEPTSQVFRDAHLGLSAELPNFTKPDGTPLLTQYNETGLDVLLQMARNFAESETLSVSGGQIFAWPAVTLREIPAVFDLAELFPPDPARFPLYSGMAQVADIARISVVPEPSTLLLLCIAALGFTTRRK